MATDVLWNESILTSGPTFSPYAVLNEQAGLVGKLTHDQLKAFVETVWFKQRDSRVRVRHSLCLGADELGPFRDNVLSVVHDRDKVYPCVIDSPESCNYSGDPEEASSEVELRNILRNVLNSSRVIAAITSIRARVHEKATGVVSPEPREQIDFTVSAEESSQEFGSSGDSVPF